ncbi:MAG: hypothetical protein M1374_04955 [Firmicutes bacterium]|nr:hypothetical protein [Bacillota bacterium]
MASLQEQADTLCEIAENERVRALVSGSMFDQEQADLTLRHANLALENLQKAADVVLQLEKEREKLLAKLREKDR